MLDDLLSQTVSEARKLLQDPKNKQAMAIAGLAYLLSKSNKERNALLAAAASLVLLPEGTKSLTEEAAGVKK